MQVQQDSQLILIGPEGDFTEEEIECWQFKKLYSCKPWRNKIKNRDRRPCGCGFVLNR